MPKYPMDYSKTVIYKIVCKDVTIKDCYVGHTTNFDGRIKQHRQACYNKISKQYNLNVYKFIRDNGGFENWSVIKIIDVECIDKFHVSQVEREYIELLQPTLNTVFYDKYKEYVIKYKEHFIKYINENIIEKCVQ